MKELEKEEEGDEEDEEIEEEDEENEIEEDEKVEQPDQEMESEDEDDLFVVKRRIEPDQDLEETNPLLETKKVFSKNQLKKIKKGGISGGKNKVYFDGEGKPISSLEYHIKQDNLKIKTDKDVDDNSKPEDYFNKLKEDLDKNRGVDDQIALERLKQKRIKNKRQRKERELMKDANRYQENEEEEVDNEEEANHKRTKYEE